MEEPIGHKHIFSVFARHPKDDGTLSHQRMGKFVVHNGNLDMLEDHSSGLLTPLREGILGEDTKRFIRNLANSSRMQLVNHQDLLDGLHPEHIKDAQTDDEQGIEQIGETPDHEQATVRNLRPPSIFQYKAQGHGKPAIVHVRENTAFIDGQPIDAAAVKTMLDAAVNGLAEIKYHVEPAQAEGPIFDDLGKIEKGLAGALGNLKSAVQSGALSPDTYAALTKELFHDTMVPSLGNKKAYQDFLSRPRPGVHVRVDANGFKGINDVHGHEAGDAAIKQMGGAFRSALDESVGRKKAKAFRLGGDEFHAHLPDHESASRFARALHSKLGDIAPIGGTHKLSVSIGMGHTPEHADKALYMAKDAKNAAGYAPGKAQTHAHSLVPGFEGAVPVQKLHAPPSVAKEPMKPEPLAPPPKPEHPVLTAIKNPPEKTQS
jgi:diguanylate cyclase (GGDEF)-like protein